MHAQRFYGAEVLKLSNGHANGDRFVLLNDIIPLRCVSTRSALIPVDERSSSMRFSGHA